MAELPRNPPRGLVREAQQHLRAGRAGTLATQSDGQPFASLVTPATAPDGSILLLLSGLSEHTRHLQAEPRCAVMVAGPADGPNPQTTPRVTITGQAEIELDPALKARWVALHPYAAFYASFADFRLWRIRPTGGLYVAGFGQALRLRRPDLTPDPNAVAAVAAAEASILAHCNDDHGDALDAIAAGCGAQGAGWRMIAVDVDGCNLMRGDGVVRVAWAASVADAGGIRAELMRLVAT